MCSRPWLRQTHSIFFLSLLLPVHRRLHINPFHTTHIIIINRIASHAVVRITQLTTHPHQSPPPAAPSPSPIPPAVLTTTTTPTITPPVPLPLLLLVIHPLREALEAVHQPVPAVRPLPPRAGEALVRDADLEVQVRVVLVRPCSMAMVGVLLFCVCCIMGESVSSRVGRRKGGGASHYPCISAWTLAHRR